MFNAKSKTNYQTKITPQQEIQMKMFNAVVLPVLLYGGTKWTLTRTEEKRLDAFDMGLLRTAAGMR